MFFTVYSISPLYFFLSISYLNLNYKKSSDNLTPNVPNYIHFMIIILQKYPYHIYEVSKNHFSFRNDFWILEHTF